MDRAQHRRLILLGIALLTGAVLLLAVQWAKTPDPLTVPATIAASKVAEPQHATDEPSTSEAAAPDVAASPPTPSAAAPIGLHGRVIDAVTRKPVKRFEVQLIRVHRDAFTENHDPPITRAFESATGHFSWPDAATGLWRAAVSAPGYQMFNVDELEIAERAPAREIVTPLLRGFAVRGRVFDSSTGAGLVDAHISFQRVHDMEGLDKSRASAKSKDDGSFTLDGVPGGEIVLTVVAREHAHRELLVMVDDKTPPQEIALSTGARIAGAVTTSSGLPVKGSIHLDGPRPGYVVDTDEAGQFSFRHMPPGRYRLSANTSAGGAKYEFTLSQDEIKEGVSLIVGAGRSIRGTIRGLPPEGLREVHILLRTQSDVVLTSSPDERGAYVLNGVPAGPADISASSGSLESEKQVHEQVDVPVDRDLTLDIIFPTGSRLSGRVTHGSKPAAHRHIWMRRVDDKDDVLYRAVTSKDGQYEIDGLPPGDYRLRADDDISRAVTIAGDAVLNIDIPSVQLSARVVEHDSAAPIVGANVYLRGIAPETARVQGHTQTDDFGQFTLTGVEPGKIILIVHKPGYEMHREEIAYSSPIIDRTIKLRKSAGVEVRVQPDSRRFPRGFTITQRFPDSEYVVDLWIPLDRNGVGHVPAALAGTTFEIGRFSGEPIVIEAWDGQPFELP